MKNLFYFIFSLSFFATLQAHALPQPQLTPFASGFTQPIGIVNAGDDRLFIVEQGGTIRIIDAGGNVNATPFLSLAGKVNTSGNERGLLGLAFHPNYAENGYFFVNYTRLPDGATVVARHQVDNENPDIADATSEKIIMTIAQPFANHNAGDLLFGPDGYLYIAVGDGGLGGDPQNFAQNHQSLLGKMLRIDIDNGDPYAIPESNPFAHDDFTRDEIWALGLRNQWRNSFDRYTGDLWIADVGQNAMEEINFQPASSTGGENYGWRCYEGTRTFNTEDCGDPESYVTPVFEYAHYGGGCSSSVTGGYVYRGALHNGLFGFYIAADYCKGDFYFVKQDGHNFTGGKLATLSPSQYSAFGEDQHGELYVALRGSGQIQKLGDASDCSPVARIMGDTLLSLAPDETITLSAFYHPTLQYRWFKNGEPIEENEGHSLIVDSFGVYTVEVTNPVNSCTSTSLPVEVMIEEGVWVENSSLSSVKVYPNPSSGYIIVEGLALDQQTEVILHDISGNRVLSINHHGDAGVNINTAGIAPGFYILSLRSEDGNHRALKVTVR